MKRLYIGGLSHSITEKDLKDRFGKFGKVQDVELRTRRDDEGVPYKSFGYINLEITDADFRKCMTVLNKSKWKGGMIQIEQAKESFLQKLSQERQEAADKTPSPNVDHKNTLLESMKKAGVENFHMKAAVPGTEVPGHNDWVVSKFGRVLPVLNLKCPGRNKIIKYDPSKHSHNIKKLETAVEAPGLTPVSMLTWEMSGGDDEISKKRRGEFPSQNTHPNKKMKESSINVVIKEDTETGVEICNGSSKKVSTTIQKYNRETKTPTKPKVTAAHTKSQTEPSVCVFDSTDDSDGEVGKLVTQTSILVETAEGGNNNEDYLEVVGDDYTPKTFLGNQQKNKNVHQLPVALSRKDEEDYDSADTDEILSSRTTASISEQDRPPVVEKQSSVTQIKNIKHTCSAKAKKADKIVPKRLVKKLAKKKVPSSESDDDDDSEGGEALTSSEAEKTGKLVPGKKSSEIINVDLDCISLSSEDENPVKKALSKKKNPPSSDDTDSEASADSEYEALFTNCQRLEFSLDDLQQLVKESFLNGQDQDSEDHECDSQQPGPSHVSEISGEAHSRDSKAPVPLAVKGKGNTPEEILAAILGDKGDEERKNKRKNKGKTTMCSSTPLPAFQGTKGLYKTTSLSSSSWQCSGDIGLKRPDEKEGKTEVSQKFFKSDTKGVCKSSASITVPGHSTSEDVKTVPASSKSLDLTKRPSNSLDGEVPAETPALKKKKTAQAEKNVDSPVLKQKLLTTAKNKRDVLVTHSASSCIHGSSSEEEEEEDVRDIAAPTTSWSVPAKKSQQTKLSKKPQSADRLVDAKQQQDNQRRLAALEQKQKEAELQKKLIQGALAKVDAPTSGQGKQHIKFSFDEDGSDDDDGVSPVPLTTKTLFQDSQSDEDDEDSPVSQKDNRKKKKSEGLARHKLFDDEDEEVDEEDGGRFLIKPQFEGESGAKLMRLQSRVGTDERFQMDSRFIDSDEEDNDVPEEESSHPVIESELSEEKKKNLNILSGVLNINVQPSVKGMKFRDISTLIYDPTKDEHTAFETKNDQPKKDSKLARKKKREEAAKLPEVSKDIYYEVSVNLKEVFGAAENETTGEERAWDEEDKEEAGLSVEVDPVTVSSLLSSGESEVPSTFKFSFFGDEENTATETSADKEEYRVQLLRGAKMSWQADPRFQDSSDEEDKDEEQTVPPHSSAIPTEEPVASKKASFFFNVDDVRFIEGPKAFCRSDHLEDQIEKWKEMRTSLVQEYRKKHKKAKRRLNTRK
ncbi:hypothetical protein UPYG_G00092140 [Umbra pygmaea]|uniref:Nucleolar protein 8 n=1 Tax=Umbra pygmaea TaxID=75934 RepID=A0ABD0XV53_UMBPY